MKKTFGECSPVQHCQVHKRRNVKEHLAPEYQRAADQRAAAASLREGLEETLAQHRLNVPEDLRRCRC